MITILGLDPGTNNMGIGVMQFKPNKYKINYIGMIDNTLKDIKTDVKHQATKFKSEINSIIKNYKVDLCVAERFMNRGATKGATGEAVMLMLGILLTCKPEATLITASQWKNSINKIYRLDEMYPQVNVVPHAVDALMMCIYASDTYYRRQRFNFNFNRVIKTINSCKNVK